MGAVGCLTGSCRVVGAVGLLAGPRAPVAPRDMGRFVPDRTKDCCCTPWCVGVGAVGWLLHPVVCCDGSCWVPESNPGSCGARGAVECLAGPKLVVAPHGEGS